MSPKSKKILAKKGTSEISGSDAGDFDNGRCGSPQSMGSVNSKGSNASSRIVNDFINRNFYSVRDRKQEELNKVKQKHTKIEQQWEAKSGTAGGTNRNPSVISRGSRGSSVTSTGR